MQAVRAVRLDGGESGDRRFTNAQTVRGDMISQIPQSGEHSSLAQDEYKTNLVKGAEYGKLAFDVFALV